MKKLILPLALAMFAASPAAAATIDFAAPVIIDQAAFEKIFTGDKPADGTTETLGKLARFALMANYPDESQTLTPTAKQVRFELGMRLINDPKVDLSLDDTKLVRDMMSKAYGTLVVGQITRLFDGKPTFDKTPAK